MLEIAGTGSGARARRGGSADAASRHAVRVARIAEQLRRRQSTLPLSLRKKSVSHQVPKRGDAKYSDERVDISDLDEILSIDPVSRTCVAESGVTFVDLVTATLRHGLVPIIVPELKTITIGGAVSGCSIESASFKYGGFHDTCLEYEVITATGDVLVCRPDNDNQLLFQIMHGTFGTLGILSRLTFRLIPAQPYVRMTTSASTSWPPSTPPSDATPRPAMRTSLTAWFTGRMTWSSPWGVSSRRRPTESVRLDEGLLPEHPPPHAGLPDHGRLLLSLRPRRHQCASRTCWDACSWARSSGSSELLRLAEKANRAPRRERPAVTVDLFLPYSKVPAFLEWHTKRAGALSTVVRPLRPGAGLSVAGRRLLPRPLRPPVRGFRNLRDEAATGRPELLPPHRRKLFELGGVKTLISHNYYTEDEFWRTWNRPNYERVKAIADPHNIFRDLYTKTCKAAQGR